MTVYRHYVLSSPDFNNFLYTGVSIPNVFNYNFSIDTFAISFEMNDRFISLKKDFTGSFIQSFLQRTKIQ